MASVKVKYQHGFKLCNGTKGQSSDMISDSYHRLRSSVTQESNGSPFRPSLAEAEGVEVYGLLL